MGFSRQGYWSGLPFPSPGDLPDLGIKPRSPALQTDTLPSEPPGKPIMIMSKDLIYNNYVCLIFLFFFLDQFLNEHKILSIVGFPGGSALKNPLANAEHVGLIPASGRSPGEGNGNPLHYSCLENPRVWGAWWAAILWSHRVRHN